MKIITKRKRIKIQVLILKSVIFLFFVSGVLTTPLSHLNAQAPSRMPFFKKRADLNRNNGRLDRRPALFGDVKFMKEKLGLSENQISKIEKINLKYRKLFLVYREKLSPKPIKLRLLLLEEKVDLKKVRLLLKEIANLQVEVRMLRIKHRLDLEKILTRDQRKKLKRYQLKRQAKRRNLQAPPKGFDLR